MCGIAGLLHLDGEPVDPARVRAMTDALRHRGPDDEGLVLPEPWVGLGHRRLSIIDIEGGRQPLSNEDGRIWITFNGEIFNYRELRRELQEKGHVFATASDTEVIVHLYEEEGVDCVKRLNGQFAFALWDGEQLFCARDALGIKPLYTYRHGNRFAFASEPRAFLRLPDFTPRLDLDGLRLFLRYRFIPAPRAPLIGLGKLMAGESLVVHRSGELRRQRYWSLDPARLEILDDPDRATRRVREGVERAVASQLVADVPVGAFLSGGLDSSTVVAAMKEHAPPGLPTFSLGFADAGGDERKFARAVADHCATRHTLGELGPEQAAELMGAVLDHIDEPLGDPAALTNLAVSRLAREEVKVVLSGDGGDELFGGYGRYYKALAALRLPPWARPLANRWKWLAQPTQDPAAWRHPDGGSVRQRYHARLMRTDAAERRALYGPALRERSRSTLDDPVERVFDRASDYPPLSQILAVDLHSILSEYYLAKVDRTSMQTSLEVRVPLLDIEFVELAFSLTPGVRLHQGVSKGLMREAMRPHLPPAVANRTDKRGFSPPLKRWFAGGLGRVARERLDGALCVEEGLIAAKALDRLLASTRTDKPEAGMLWQVLVLESWLRNLRGRFSA